MRAIRSGKIIGDNINIGTNDMFKDITSNCVVAGFLVKIIRNRM